LPNPDDGVHDLAARLVEKLGQPQGRGLVLYSPWKQRNADKAFEDWLHIVTKNMIRDYLREKVGTERPASGEISAKGLLNEFATSPLLEELGIRPPLTLAQTARELFEFAKGRLAPDELAILESWIAGASFEEIAGERNLSEDSARQLLRSAVAILRRYFSGDKSD
jgi:RNA polymerase sigma factor (sigma-70 family)